MASVTVAVESALLLPLLVPGDVDPRSARRPPLLLLTSSGQDKSDFEKLGLASSRLMCWARRPWISVRDSTSPQDTCLSVRYPQPSSKCAVTAVSWWAGAVLHLANSRALRITWAWPEVISTTLPYLERAWVSLYINALACIDIPILPRLLGRSTCNKKCTKSRKVLSLRHQVMQTSYFAIFDFLLLLFFFVLCNSPTVFSQNL